MARAGICAIRQETLAFPAFLMYNKHNICTVKL